jgi:hypothetical protein
MARTGSTVSGMHLKYQAENIGGARDELGKSGDKPMGCREKKKMARKGTEVLNSEGFVTMAMASRDFLTAWWTVLTEFSITALWLGLGRWGCAKLGTRIPVKRRQNAITNVASI